MERKTKHRILGILVVIGLIIILLPLFQGEKETTTNTALVTAPPFPDQPVQVPTVTDQNQIKVAEQTNIPPAVVNNPPTTSADNSTVKQQPDDTISVLHPSIINSTEQPVVEKPTTTETSDKPEMTTSTDSSDDNKSISNSKSAEVLAKNSKTSAKTAEFKIIENHKKDHGVKKSMQTASKHVPKVDRRSPQHPTAVQMASDDKDGLVKLKGAAWVIQIGSYKNKTNALRIVNQLRANGYRAFIQQVSTALGDHTRVYIGPENKRASARALADRLHNEMHIQGIVISYKPLTL